ncbi:MAG: AAA family ATPase [Sulfurovum sp.]|nr:AAA family ATPase [Sulfurovum sp.]
MSSFDRVIEALGSRDIFLTGGAGVGKSYVTNEVISSYRKDGKQVVALGSTGVSAVNVGGFTIHSFFAFGISGNFEELTRSDKRSKKRLSDLKKILKATDLIVIDEISMVSTDLMDMILYRLENYTYSGRLMLVGDFYQLPPIVKDRSGLFGESLFAFESTAWARIDPAVLELTQMKRTQDEYFAHILSKVREGNCDEEVVGYMFDLCNHDKVYDNEPTYLFGRNAEVEQMNRASLNRLDTEEMIIFAEFEKFGPMHAKRLESWIKLLPVSEQLTLKVGVPILFTVNKWGKFVNGERGFLRAIHDDYLLIEKDEEYVRVERHEFDLLDMVVHDDGSVEQISLATLKQFPLKLAYAVTIHKSQGMSIDYLVCNVDNIFAPSQFYVAISRATDPKNLKIDFSRGDISRYLRKVIHVDERVAQFYREYKSNCVNSKN